MRRNRTRLVTICAVLVAALWTLARAQQEQPSTSATVDARLWAKNTNGVYVPVVLDGSSLPTSTTGGDAGGSQQLAPSTSGTVDARLWVKNAAGVYVPVVLDSNGRVPVVLNTGSGTALTFPGTLSIASGKTFTASNTMTQTATDGSTVAFGAGGTVLYNGGAMGTPSSLTLTNASGLVQSGITRQVVNTQTGAVATGTTTIPVDDTIPQITEGTEFMTLAITPTSATNKLKVDVTFSGGTSVGGLTPVVALFQDSTANALAATWTTLVAGAGTAFTLTLSHYMTAGTTSSTTFRVRAGGSSASTLTFNGSGGSRFFGGVMASSITITEIVP